MSLGCYYHGCLHLYSVDQVHPVLKISIEQINTQQEKVYDALRADGYTVVVKRECDFRKEVAEKAEIKEFVEGLDVQTCLDPRNAFMGGRCEAFKLYVNLDQNDHINKGKSFENIKLCTNNLQMKYIDYNSLYPSVNANRLYPKYIPERITHDFADVSAYFGLIKLKIKPPRGLYLPCLPYRNKSGKLLFPLCATCAETMEVKCEHTDDQRCFIGTYCTPEVLKAISIGESYYADY